jgi:hypothetical protein
MSSTKSDREGVNASNIVLTTLNASFNAADNRYRMPNLYGKPVWFADLGGRLVQPGDYLIRTTLATDIYFIAGMQSLLPIIAVDCPRSVKITGAPVTTGGGTNGGFVGYAGLCDTEGQVLAGSTHPWPCSITFGKGTESMKSPLPSGASKQIGWQILLPPSLPITIEAGTRLVDDLGRMFVTAGAELTDLGWRIQATEVHA